MIFNNDFNQMYIFYTNLYIYFTVIFILNLAMYMIII
jgi:hypothetical protein